MPHSWLALIPEAGSVAPTSMSFFPQSHRGEKDYMCVEMKYNTLGSAIPVASMKAGSGRKWVRMTFHVLFQVQITGEIGKNSRVLELKATRC